MKSKKINFFSKKASALILLYIMLLSVFCAADAMQIDISTDFDDSNIEVYLDANEQLTLESKAVSAKSAVKNLPLTENALIPGGFPFGVKFYTKGVIVVGISDVETENGTSSPAAQAGIKKGDVITAVNSKKINSISELTKIIEASNGNELTFDIEREGKNTSIKITPALTKNDKIYKSGLWVRDSTAGIGIVTFIDPQNKTFAGLGHGICDVDTGELMPMLKASVVNIDITNVVKGQNGKPGELKGAFTQTKLGELTKNTPTGVYGVFSSLPAKATLEPMPCAKKEDVKVGDVIVYTTVSDRGMEGYNAKIIKINDLNSQTKNFIIEITDKKLLEQTGGIVQGMSGSPIIQNGKLIGAVTHVLVNDPTKGYGIFIENMLAQAEKILH